MYCQQVKIGDLLVLNTYKDNLCIKFKENNENDMTAHAFWAVFCSSQQPSQIVPTAENESAAIPPPIFFLNQLPNLFTDFISNLDQALLSTSVFHFKEY